VPFDELAQRGIALREVERGGKATYHGPGQLVGYLVAPVRQLAPDLPTYVWRIEEALLRVVTGYDVRASRDPRNHGLWVGDAKLAFIGIAVHRGVAWHGFALNVEPDLSAFDLIRPCGLDVAVTALAAHVSPVPHVEAVAGEAARRVAEVFGLIQAPVASALW
jgi:lipoate-protein ligase B